MNLSDILSFRNKPAAGVYLALTRRCPLLCEHCSTNSTLYSKETLDQNHILEFVRSMSKNPPKLIYLTGGEPLMRPQIVKAVNALAKGYGIDTALLSGMFFANEKDINPHIAEAISGLSHFSASLDFYHEKQVSRENVFKALRHIRDKLGVTVSLQITGLKNDPYIDGLVADISDNLGKETAVFVTEIGAAGRGTNLFKKKTLTKTMEHQPCMVASWPVVSYTGNIVACCNQQTVDAVSPADHLLLGHIKNTSWPEVREKTLQREKLRLLRTVGPCTLLKLSGKTPEDTFCGSCHKVETVKADEIATVLQSKTFKLTEIFLADSNITYTKSKYKSLIS